MSASADLRRRYPLLVELGLLIALALVVAAFAAPLNFSDDVTVSVTPDEAIQAVEIPVTVHPRDLPPPPPAPVEVPNDEIIDEPLDLPSLTEDLLEPVVIPTLPPPLPDDNIEEEREPEIFVVVEEPPELIGGLAGLQRGVAYPELARRAGIEGKVTVQFVVDEEGRVTQATVFSDPGGGLGAAALDAVRAAHFTPGKQRGKPVKVRLSLPVYFRLR